MNTLAILIACGREQEIAAGVDVAFLPLGKFPMLIHSLKALEEASSVQGVIIVVSKNRIDSIRQIARRYGCFKVCGAIVGGTSRLASVRNALQLMQKMPSAVVIHEASRPFVSSRVIDETIKSAKRYGCAISAHRLPDATKLSQKGHRASETLTRNAVWSAQTPQTFKMEVLSEVLSSKGLKVIDDESEWIDSSLDARMIESGGVNLKVRTKSDLAVASALLHAGLNVEKRPLLRCSASSELD